jgi:Holliday junction resolvasome RuvABC endonuclease subunit
MTHSKNMTNTSLKFLGLNPGTRYLGLALLEGPVLQDWRIRVVQGKGPKQKLAKAKEIIGLYLRQHQPDVLVLKRLHPSRSSRTLGRLVSEIKIMARRRQMRGVQFSIGEVESLLCPEGRKNKRRLAEVLASVYAVLHHELNREQENRNPYHVRMFEAVGLAVAGYHRLGDRAIN